MVKKKIVLILVTLVVMMTAVMAQSKPVVAVAPFTGVGDVSENDTAAVTELFTSQLVMEGKFNIVEHANLDAVVSELKFQTKDWSSDIGKVNSVGKALNAQYVVRGQLMKLGSQYFLSTSVVKLEGLEVIASSREQFGRLEDVMNVLPKMSSTICERMVPTPKVPPRPKETVPSSPLIGVWRADAGNDNRLTIEFREGNKLVVRSMEWKELNYVYTPFGTTTRNDYKSATGDGNWSEEGGRLSMYIRLDSGKIINYKGSYSLEIGNTQLKLDDSGIKISAGDYYEYTSIRFTTFHKQ